MKIILATWNSKKFSWLSQGFSKANLPIVPVNKKENKDVEETGLTCSENALIKVRSIGPLPNSIIVGEDSGLFIDALNGFPGVKTVRWMEGTDDDRSYEILEKMKNIPDKKRTARFISSVALICSDGTERIFEGVMEGKISSDPVGESGRGYRRIFLLDNGKSIAESDSKLVMKNDHRYQAMEKAVIFIKDLV